MKRLRWLLLVAIVAVAFVHYRSHAAPSAREVESALRVYLSSPKSQNCSGSMTLEQLDEVRVGEYAEQFGGWPVYAAHRETCHEENRSSGYSSRYSQTFDGRRDGERNVAVAFVRRSVTGQVEVFVHFDGRRDGERNVAVAFVRRSVTGQVEVFVPGLF